MITEHAKKRFCKDQNLSINVFEEPYFSSRLSLYGQLEKYNEYLETIKSRFDNNEEAYLAYYNETKDKIIDYIKASKAYNALQVDDMNKYSKHENYPTHDVYKDTNIGKYYVSIDMSKANYTALVHYGKTYGIPFVSDTIGYNYTDFIRQFTDIEHIINSKYIRQVVFGNCNPKRQITYETYLMQTLIDDMFLNDVITKDKIISVRADEIILDGTDYTNKLQRNYVSSFVTEFAKRNFPVKFEFFQLGKITNSDAFVKNVLNENNVYVPIAKCVSPDEMPFVYKLLKDLPLAPEDMVFSHNGKLAKFLDIPQMELTYENNTI